MAMPSIDHYTFYDTLYLFNPIIVSKEICFELSFVFFGQIQQIFNCLEAESFLN
jgi:hypothetical protein